MNTKVSPIRRNFRRPGGGGVPVRRLLDQSSPPRSRQSLRPRPLKCYIVPLVVELSTGNLAIIQHQNTKPAANTPRIAQFLNVELGDKDLTAFAYHPGRVLTHLARNLLEELQRILIDNSALAAGFILCLTTLEADSLNDGYSHCRWEGKELERYGLLVSAITRLTAGLARA